MAVRISRSLLDRLLAEAHAAPEEEVCGLLFGSDGCIAAAERTANVAADRARRFEVDPARLFAAHRAWRAGGPAVAGCYHSHPVGLPEPSATDHAAATGDGAVWLILAGGEARSWRSTTSGVLVATELIVTP